MRKLSGSSEDHTVNEWQSSDLSPGGLTSEFAFITFTLCNNLVGTEDVKMLRG